MRTLEGIHYDLTVLSTALNNEELYNLVQEIREHISALDEKKAAKDWKKGTGTIRVNEGKTATVEVYRNSRYPGVVIHRQYGAPGEILKKWNITHELSGLSISSGYSNMRKAVKAFLEHAADVNWNMPEAELVKDTKVRTAYENINKRL